jgi:hypothetical protein
MGSAAIKEHDLTFPSFILVPRREYRVALLNLKKPDSFYTISNSFFVNPSTIRHPIV